MAKRKRRQSRNKNLIKQTIQFELVALLLIAIAIISLANMGKGGHTVVLFFRFFLGEWYFLGPIGMIIYGGYLMWKRQRPILFSVKLMGLYIIIASIMLLTHIPLFELPSNGNRFGNPSVMEITWDLFMKEARGQANPDGLGGGMAGAVLFVLFYFLFDEAGTKLFAIVLMMIGFILFTGKTFGGALNKIFSSLWAFFTKQWLGFKEDMNNWRQGLKEKREMKHAQKQEKRARLELENQETRSSPIIHVATQAQEESVRPEPIISNFADRAYQQNDEQKTVDEDVEEVVVVVEEDLQPIAFTEVENVDYQLPSIDLLKQPRHTDQSGEYALIHENAAKLERTFQSFGVKANVTQVHLGPAVTKYEVHPDVGVKVSKIVSLTDDLGFSISGKRYSNGSTNSGKICDWNRSTKFRSGHCFIA